VVTRAWPRAPPSRIPCSAPSAVHRLDAAAVIDSFQVLTSARTVDPLDPHRLLVAGTTDKHSLSLIAGRGAEALRHGRAAGRPRLVVVDPLVSDVDVGLEPTIDRALR